MRRKLPASRRIISREREDTRNQLVPKQERLQLSTIREWSLVEPIASQLHLQARSRACREMLQVSMGLEKAPLRIGLDCIKSPPKRLQGNKKRFHRISQAQVGQRAHAICAPSAGESQCNYKFSVKLAAPPSAERPCQRCYMGLDRKPMSAIRQQLASKQGWREYPPRPSLSLSLSLRLRVFG